MAYFTLSVAAPTLSAYDPDNPTQATEELNIQLHNILQDMEDAGFYIAENRMDTTALQGARSAMRDMTKNVFDYAKSAIHNYRDTGDPNLSEPVYTGVTAPVYTQYHAAAIAQWQHYATCIKIMYMIYYLWETEDDPLLLKEYIRSMLLAWPLQDIQINLADDSGSQLKIFPAWRHIET